MGQRTALLNVVDRLIDAALAITAEPDIVRCTACRGKGPESAGEALAESHKQLQYFVLLNLLDSLIYSALAIADTIDEPSRRQMQAWILTSPAFLNMSCADAADVLGVAAGTVGELLDQLAHSHPRVTVFNHAWSATGDLGYIDDVK